MSHSIKIYKIHMEIRRPRTAGQPHTTYPQGRRILEGQLAPQPPPPQILAEAKPVPSKDLGLLIDPSSPRFLALPTALLHILAGKLQATTDHIVNGNENTYLANKMKSRKMSYFLFFFVKTSHVTGLQMGESISELKTYSN